MPKIPVVCKHCGKSILKWPFEIASGRDLFCSKKCAYADRKGQWTNKKNPRWNGGQIAKNCLQCGKPFPSRPLLIKHQFCSEDCMNAFRKRHRITLTCPQCGKSFERIPSEIKQGKSKFCSYVCRGRWQREHKTHKGEKSANWKGGPKGWPSRQPDRLREYNTERLARLNNCVMNDFTKDDWHWLLALFKYRCFYCLRPSNALEIDHIKPLLNGGSHTLSNIVPACRSCNAQKRTRSLWNFAMAGGLSFVLELPLSEQAT